MKYKYIYKSSDGVRHEAFVDAKCRDDVFVQLRAKKIKPIKVLASDGSLDNGAVNGVRRRVVATVAVAAALVAAVLAFSIGSSLPRNSVEVGTFDSTMRRQIIGDALMIEKNIKNGWADVFETEGERFLASFAVPGVPAGVRNTTIDEIRASLDRKPILEPDDSIEKRQIVSMVEGMKNELRAYIKAGGTIPGYCERIVQRQEQEIGYYQRVKTELETASKAKMSYAELERLWEKRNGVLRKMGIKLVPMPDD